MPTNGLRNSSNRGIKHKNLDAATLVCGAFEPAPRFGYQKSQIIVWLKEPWWVLVHPGFVQYV
jgi:hypothetical protein